MTPPRPHARAALLAILVLAAGPAAAQSTPSGIPLGATPGTPALVVRRASSDSAVFTAAQLGAFPRRDVQVTEHGHPARFSGVPLQDVLRAAGVRTDSLRGAALADVLVAEAADGYRVAFTLAELSPDFGARTALLVDRRDGAPLGPSEGPLRLVLPDDRRPARWIRQLRAISVRHTGAAPDAGTRGRDGAPGAERP